MLLCIISQPSCLLSFFFLCCMQSVQPATTTLVECWLRAKSAQRGGGAQEWALLTVV
jgi:hypothetical protein